MKISWHRVGNIINIMCIFKVSSHKDSFNDFLKENPDFPVYKVYDKGDEVELRSEEFATYEDYGFLSEVSDRPWSDFDGQCIDIISFLEVYQPHLLHLKENYNIEDWRFDLPYECKLDEHRYVQSDFLPSKALKLMGELGIGIELSLYWPEE